MKQSVLIQIDRMPDVGGVGHMSMRIDGLSVHSTGPLLPVNLRGGSGKRAINETTIFKLDIGPEMAAAMKEKLQNSPILHSGSLGCANGTVKVLEEVVGVTVPNPSLLYGTTTHATIRDILSQGLVGKYDGKTIAYSIHSTYLGNAQDLLKQARHTDNAVVAAYAGAGIGSGLLMVAIGQDFYAVVDGALRNVQEPISAPSDVPTDFSSPAAESKGSDFELPIDALNSQDGSVDYSDATGKF